MPSVMGSGTEEISEFICFGSSERNELGIAGEDSVNVSKIGLGVDSAGSP